MLTNKKKDFYENCTALRCYHLGGEQCAQLCATITLLVISNVLEYRPVVTAGDSTVLACRMTSRRTEIAAESP
jgi:hypothetical protein